MNKKTNLFVCVLAILSINLQYDIAAYALDTNDPTINENKPEPVIDESNTDTAIIEEGTEFSVTPFTDEAKVSEDTQIQ